MTQHINIDTLGDFVKETLRVDSVTADSNNMDSLLYNDILDHLADCETCRDQVSIITTLQNEWSQLRHQSSLSEAQQQLICDYIEGRLPAGDAEKAKALINDSADAMKAALHYQSHVESMKAQLSREGNVSTKEHVYQTRQSTPQTQNAFFANLLFSIRQFFNIQLPMVYTLTATAALFIAILLLMQSPELQQNRVVIASYQDNPTIQFTTKNKLPGVGFFAQSASTSKPFKDIRVELISDNSIKISWPAIDGAALYKMRIQVFNQGKKTLLKENSTQTNHTIFELENESRASAPNRRYEWVLYGNTTDKRMFYASGGFVISKARSGSAAENERDADSW